MKKTLLSALLCLLFTAGYSQDQLKLASLNTARWEHSRKKASLVLENSTLIEMEFGRKATLLKFNDDKFEISKRGFWCPRILISKNGEVVATQKYASLLGSKKTFEIDGKMYTAVSKQKRHSTITYSYENAQMLTYKLDGSKRKPVITFQINPSSISQRHLYLLLGAGFYSIRNSSDDNGAAILIVMVAASH
jgi:hypothetical protein